MSTRRVAQTIILIAMVVALSPFFIPLGPAKIFPFQHMANVIAAVLLGPWYAVVMATCTAIVRLSLGLGTVFAFPGGMIGAFLAGWAYRWVKSLRAGSPPPEIEADTETTSLPYRLARALPPEAYGAALGEIIGTGIIGAAVSAMIVDPLLVKKGAGLAFFIAIFSPSTIGGSIIGLFCLWVLRRAGYWK